MKQPTLYILTNKGHVTLYTGVTSHLIQRIYQHKHENIPGFSSKYKCKKLVYYELFEDMTTAITREKQLKKYTRQKKWILITSMNPHWEDLYDEIVR